MDTSSRLTTPDPTGATTNLPTSSSAALPLTPTATSTISTATMLPTTTTTAVTTVTAHANTTSSSTSKTASELFNEQVDEQKLQFLNERLGQLQTENEILRVRHDKREQETHEFVAYFQKEINSRDRQVTKLNEEIANLKLSHSMEIEAFGQQKEKELSAMNASFAEQQENHLQQVFFLKEELTELERFRDLKETIQAKTKELEKELSETKQSHKEFVNTMERRFLEEKAKIQKEQEKKIEQVKQQAKEDARNGLDADTRKIVTDNIRMGEELRFQLQMSDELQKERNFFEFETKKLKREIDLAKQKDEEFANQSQKQHREIQQLKAHVKTLEKKLGEQHHRHLVQHHNAQQAEQAAAALLGGATSSGDSSLVGSIGVGVAGGAVVKQLEEARLDIESLKNLLKLKNKELRNMRRLAQTILDQRSDVEQFFLDALDQTKKQIALEKKKSKDNEMEKYRQEMKKANWNVRFPQLKANNNVVPLDREVSSTQPGGRFHDKVDLKDLSWEDRERVLRLLFAKINGMQSLADVADPSAASTPAAIPTPPQQCIYFATEHASQTGPTMPLNGFASTD